MTAGFAAGTPRRTLLVEPPAVGEVSFGVADPPLQLVVFRIGGNDHA